MSIGLPEEETPFTTPVSPGNAGILVVDEDPAFQLGLKTFLREYVGFESVFTARSGQEALDILESEESIDIITLDYRMPGMNGIEFLQILSEREHRLLSVVMITGYPSEELEAEFLSFDSPDLLVSQFLTKPVEFDRLEPIILHSHEELLAARQAKEAALLEQEDQEDDILDVEATEVEEPDTSIKAALAEQTRKISYLEYEVKSLRGKWRGDIVMFVFIVFLLWVAGEFGAFRQLGIQWEGCKEQIFKGIEEYNAKKDQAETPATQEATPAEATPEPAPTREENPPSNSDAGQPL